MKSILFVILFSFCAFIFAQPATNTTANPAADNPTVTQDEVKANPISSDTIPLSLRDDNAVAGSDINLIRKPLPYARINPSDVAWKQRVWEEIDTRQKINSPLTADRNVDDMNTIFFIDVLFEGLKKGAFQVFSDEKFTRMLTAEEVAKVLQGTADTMEVTDATDPRGLRKIKKNCF